jgi:site-specific recombinase XerD
MSIFKRGGKYWYHFLHEGKHIQKSTGQGNPRVARQIEAAFRTALAKGEVGITERKKIPSFKVAMTDFLLWSEQEHQLHPETHERYRVSSVALLRHFKDASLDQITPEEVERFKAIRLMENKTVRAPKKKRRQLDKKLRPATVNRELACLKALFNFVLKADLPLRNPVSRVKFFEEHNEQTRVLTFEEQEKYLAAATPLLRDVATLMVETGMRPEEVYRMRAENVHLAEGYLFNPHGKTKAARSVPLQDGFDAPHPQGEQRS